MDTVKNLFSVTRGLLPTIAQLNPEQSATTLINHAKTLDANATARISRRICATAHLPYEITDIIFDHTNDTNRCHNHLFRFMMSMCNIDIPDKVKYTMMLKQFKDVLTEPTIKHLYNGYSAIDDDSYAIFCKTIIASFTAKQLEQLYSQSPANYRILMMFSPYSYFTGYFIGHIHLSGRLFIEYYSQQEVLSHLIEPINNLSTSPLGLHSVLERMNIACNLIATITGCNILIRTIGTGNYQFAFILSRAEFEAWKVANPAAQQIILRAGNP